MRGMLHEPYAAAQTMYTERWMLTWYCSAQKEGREDGLGRLPRQPMYAHPYPLSLRTSKSAALARHGGHRGHDILTAVYSSRIMGRRNGLSASPIGTIWIRCTRPPRRRTERAARIQPARLGQCSRRCTWATKRHGRRHGRPRSQLR